MNRQQRTIIGWLVTGFAVVLGAAIAQGAGPGAEPDISPVYPPAKDVRAPDRTIGEVEKGAVSVVVYDTLGRVCATAGADKVIRVWDAATGEQNTGKLVRSFEGHGGRVFAVMFSTDGKTLVSTAADGTVRSWDAASGKELASMPVGYDLERAALKPGACSGADAVLAEVEDDAVKLWNYETGAMLKFLEQRDEKTLVLAFTPDGKRIAGGTDKGSVFVWDCASGEQVAKLDAGPAVRSLATSATHLVAGCEDGSIKAWKLDALDAKTPVSTIKAHDGAVHSVAVRADQIASAGADKSVKVWDLASGTLMCTQAGHDGEVFAVAISPNGQKMATGGADHTLRYWTLPLPPIPAELLEKIKAALPAKVTAAPKQARKLLVFWRADAITHKAGVPAANHALELMGAKTGAFTVDFTRDYAALNPTTLARYDAIVMNSTAHLAIPDEAKKAYLDYANGGGGVIGIHAAIDTFKGWPEGAAVIGATFANHPWSPAGTWAVKIDDRDHVLNRAWAGKDFKIRDEVYEMGEPYTRADRRVLLTLDMTDAATAGVTGLHRKDGDFAVAWIKRAGKGRVFYCDFGHRGEPFADSAVLRFYLDGIQYVVGDLQVDDTPRK